MPLCGVRSTRSHSSGSATLPATAEATHLGGDRIDRLRVEVDGDHPGPLGGEERRGGPADAGGRAGDDDVLVLEAHGRTLRGGTSAAEQGPEVAADRVLAAVVEVERAVGRQHERDGEADEELGGLPGVVRSSTVGSWVRASAASCVLAAARTGPPSTVSRRSSSGSSRMRSARPVARADAQAGAERGDEPLLAGPRCRRPRRRGRRAGAGPRGRRSRPGARCGRRSAGRRCCDRRRRARRPVDLEVLQADVDEQPAGGVEDAAVHVLGRRSGAARRAASTAPASTWVATLGTQAGTDSGRGAAMCFMRLIDRRYGPRVRR